MQPLRSWLAVKTEQKRVNQEQHKAGEWECMFDKKKHLTARFFYSMITQVT